MMPIADASSRTDARSAAVSIAFVHRRFSPDRLRAYCSIAALVLGAAAAWASRTTMYPDGISYLDIGDAYWRGDWHNALNTYWSPLYSWLVGAALKVVKPSLEHEFPLVHAVNFLQYAIALAAFTFFVKTFAEKQLASQDSESSNSEMWFPQWALYVTGYTGFVIASLSLITMSFVSADMLVAAIVYLASALLLRMDTHQASWKVFVGFGLVLGIGYCAKTVMLPMAIVFLIVALVIRRRNHADLKPVAYSCCILALAVAPFAVAISAQKHRPTIGESGVFNYLVNVQGGQFFIPHEPEVENPVPVIPGNIEAYQYAAPISGTYPLWYDPSYWHEHIPIHFSLSRQLRTMAISAIECGWILFNIHLGLTISVAILFLYFVSPRPYECFRAALRHWILWIPAIAGIAMYGLLIIEPRYLGAQFCILWIVALAGVRLPKSSSSRYLIAGTVLFLVTATSAITLRDSWLVAHNIGVDERDIATPQCATAAEALRAAGLQPRDKIAVISNWLFPSRQGAYIARLVRVRIIAEARSKDFWAADEPARSQLMAAFAHAGVKAVLTRNPPRLESGWQQLRGTSYYVYAIGESSAPGEERHP